MGEIKIDALKLDTFVKKQNMKTVDLIKIDVEGAELDVLKGAQKTLSEKHPKVIVELEGNKKTEVFKLLKGLGYKIHDYKGGRELHTVADMRESKVREILCV